MARIIHTQSPGKTRHYYRRTVAEILRRLSQKQSIDDEAKDQVALIVLCLQGMADTVDRTVTAWEKRDYWMKAERFSRKWTWLDPMADQLSEILYEERWDDLPGVLAQLLPHFADITVKRLTRKSTTWRGAYAKLMQDG
jgi:hypothetical protein